MRRAASGLVLLAASLGSAAALAADEPFLFSRDCAQYLERHGYSIDYIVKKVGSRQRGFAPSWRGNVEPRDVQPGDVVISQLRNKPGAMRVAYVEDVRRNADGSAGAVFVSEWNWGKYTDERCQVTDHFGRLSESKPLTVDTLVKVWRPTLPLPPVN